MQTSNLMALSPLDGRYASRVTEWTPIWSEYGLIHHRVMVEIHWLIALAACPKIPELEPFAPEALQALQSLMQNFSLEQAQAIKQLEAKTNHDVKAVEYWLSEQLMTLHLDHYRSFVHFGCTSEDINNLAYGLMLKKTQDQILQPQQNELIAKLQQLAHEHASVAMLSRTHGQPASPTTLGKEWANFAHRLQSQALQQQNIPIMGKCNGAVGNWNAHQMAYPEVDWPALSQKFIQSLGLEWQSYSTQIEPHDQLAALLHALERWNTVLIGLCRDVWGYISLNYLGLKVLGQEVGSSTMPHKVNPIDFENAEGNLGLANALIVHCAQKLPISRWQRDLSDSTVQRNLGVIFGYGGLAYRMLLQGLNKLSANTANISADLNQHWEVLAEPIQTVLRRYGVADAYEQLKALTRGKALTHEMLQDFINNLSLPAHEKQRLLALKPDNYLGYAAQWAQDLDLV